MKYDDNNMCFFFSITVNTVGPRFIQDPDESSTNHWLKKVQTGPGLFLFAGVNVGALSPLAA